MLSPQFVPLHDLHSELLLAAAATFLPVISFPQEPMVSEHLRIRNKNCCFLNVQKTHFASLEMLSGVYAGVIFKLCGPLSAADEVHMEWR